MSIIGGPDGDLCGTCGQYLDACVCGPIVYHPDEFFIDDSYTCKLCGYSTDSEEDFVGHILDAHEEEARASNAVSTGIGSASGTEYWDVDSIALAEEFDAS